MYHLGLIKFIISYGHMLKLCDGGLWLSWISDQQKYFKVLKRPYYKEHSYQVTISSHMWFLEKKIFEF